MMTWRLKDLIEHCSTVMTETADHRWVPAKPINHRSIVQRIREGWSVFTGESDSFKWPEDEAGRR